MTKELIYLLMISLTCCSCKGLENGKGIHQRMTSSETEYIQTTVAMTTDEYSTQEICLHCYGSLVKVETKVQMKLGKESESKLTNKTQEAKHEK